MRRARGAGEHHASVADDGHARCGVAAASASKAALVGGQRRVRQRFDRGRGGRLVVVVLVVDVVVVDVLVVVVLVVVGAWSSWWCSTSMVRGLSWSSCRPPVVGRRCARTAGEDQRRRDDGARQRNSDETGVHDGESTRGGPPGAGQPRPTMMPTPTDATVLGSVGSAMSWELSDDHELLRATVREFAEQQIAPHAAEWDRTCHFPVDVVQAMGDLGLFGIVFPERWGGGGGDFASLCVAIEELGRDRSVDGDHPVGRCRARREPDLPVRHRRTARPLAPGSRRRPGARRVRADRARRRVRCRGDPHPGRVGRRRVGAQRFEGVHHELRHRHHLDRHRDRADRRRHLGVRRAGRDTRG